MGRKQKRNTSRIDFLRKKFIGKEISYPKEHQFNSSEDPIEIEPSTFDHIINKIDPTFNKVYSSWLLNIYSKGLLMNHDFHKANEYLAFFDKHKNKLDDEGEFTEQVEVDRDIKSVTQKIKLRNINNYRSLNHLYKEIEHLMEMDEEELMSTTELYNKKKEEGVDIVFENDRWKVVIPLTQETANIYGKSSQWCTTSSKGGGREFYDYRRQGLIYIILDKEAEREGSEVRQKHHKFQFHFERKEFMDATNERIDLTDFFGQHPILLKAFCSLRNSFGLYLRFKFNIDVSEEDKVIEGNINFRNFDITGDMVAEGLHIKGNASFRDTQIKKVKNIRVDGHLDIEGSELEEIEGELIVGKCLKAANSKIKRLPDNCKIGQVADFGWSDLQEVPFGMEVGQHCYMNNCKVKEVKKGCNIKVGDILYAHGLGLDLEELNKILGDDVGVIYCDNSLTV